jgi:MFS family permease
MILKKINNSLSIVFLTLFLDKLGENIVYPLLPFILAAYKPSAFMLGLIASVGTFFSVLTGPLIGSLSDALGRRLMILACIALNMISLLMFGFAGSLPVILFSRALYGVSISAMGTLQAYIVDVSKPENRSRNLGISGAAFGMGAIGGPALGSGLMGLGLNVPIFVAAALSGYNLLSATFFLQETIPAADRKKPNFATINIFKPITQLLRQKTLNRIALGFAAFNIGFSAYINLLILALKNQYNWTPIQTSGLLIIVGVSLTVAQLFLIGKAVQAWGEFRVNRIGMLLAAGGILLLALAPVMGALTTTSVVLSGMILALGSAFVVPTSRSLVSGLVPSSQQGAILGSLASLTGVSSVIGPIAAGALYDITPLACFAFEALTCITGAVLLGRNPSRDTTMEDKASLHP